MGHRDPHSDRTTDVVQVQDEWPPRALGDERVDDRGHVIEGRSQDSRCRSFAEPDAGVVGRDDMKPILQKRNEIVELVRRRGKTVQQDDRRLRRLPGLAVEEPEALNFGGLEVHRGSFSPHRRSSESKSRFLECTAIQAALTESVNVAAFFLTNSCMLNGVCPVSVNTSSDIRSYRPARCRSAIVTRWFTR